MYLHGIPSIVALIHCHGLSISSVHWVCSIVCVDGLGQVPHPTAHSPRICKKPLRPSFVRYNIKYRGCCLLMYLLISKYPSQVACSRMLAVSLQLLLLSWVLTHFTVACTPVVLAAESICYTPSSALVLHMQSSKNDYTAACSWIKLGIAVCRYFIVWKDTSQASIPRPSQYSFWARNS